MPRVDNNRGSPLTYKPGPIPAPGSTPEQISRAVWEELERLATYVAQIPLSTTPREERTP